MMPFLSQHNFPILWEFFQYWIGGTTDKRRLCLRKYNGQKRVLEVGCSVGNIARAFQSVPEISYTGIDIDSSAIRRAQQKYNRVPQFRFVSQDLRDFSESEARFDYILFAGVCHHIEDGSLRGMMHAARDMLSERGILIVVDFLIPRSDDSWFLKLFWKIDQGGFARNEEQMETFPRNVDGLRLSEVEMDFIGCTPFSWPLCARFGIYTLHGTET
jgi:cyclopropane fatty-acyl-phospholipid synthase-like methyltransferase